MTISRTKRRPTECGRYCREDGTEYKHQNGVTTITDHIHFLGIGGIGVSALAQVAQVFKPSLRAVARLPRARGDDDAVDVFPAIGSDAGTTRIWV